MKKAILRTYLDEKNNILFHQVLAAELSDSLRELNHLDTTQGHHLSQYLAALLPFCGLLKNQEGIGIYISNNDKSFFLNLEMDYQGKIRLMFVPKKNYIAERIIGQARLVKILPDQKQYTSIIPLENVGPQEIANNILHHSYQIHASLRSNPTKAEGVLGMRLPFLGGVKVDSSPAFQNERWEKFTTLAYDNAISTCLSESSLLNEKEIVFSCRCQRENFITGLLTLSEADRHEIFSHTPKITLQCDYCHTEYIISQDEIINQLH